MAWIRCCGGSAKKKISKDVGALTITQPSNTTQSNVARTFVKNSRVNGLAHNNLYLSTNCEVARVDDDTFTVTGRNAAWYGCGYVMPSEVVGGSTLHIDITASNTDNAISVNTYQANGTFINGTEIQRYQINTVADVAIPSNAEYIVLLFIPTEIGAPINFTINNLSVS